MYRFFSTSKIKKLEDMAEINSESFFVMQTASCPNKKNMPKNSSSLILFETHLYLWDKKTLKEITDSRLNDLIDFTKKILDEFPGGDSKSIMLKFNMHRELSLLLYHTPIPAYVAQANYATFTCREASGAVTSGISNCSVLLITNQNTKDFFFAHVGPNGFSFDTNHFTNGVVDFANKQESLEDCVGVFIRGIWSDLSYCERIKNSIKDIPLKFLDDIQCPSEELYHLSVLYDAHKEYISYQYGSGKIENIDFKSLVLQQAAVSNKI